MRHSLSFLPVCLIFLLAIVPAWRAAGADAKPVPPGLAALNAYFEQQVSSLEGQLERDIKTKEDWLKNKDEYRRQLAEMLGLDPMPPRTDLMPVITGTFEHEGIMVENLHFQAMPGLYVTCNLYRPQVVEKPLPTVLYVCGHSNKTKDGVSYGNKAGYEHHGVWYAKHGFVCLVIDTVELGEIRGEHHGTYSKGRFWWWSRGYTPAGCEAWQGIRALDYLETRPEVDKTRFGVTGRSGGGAYSWWIAALDDRIKCTAPTAGITTLRNHVVDGCVEGHCDCMFMVNTYRWDYDKVAALVAPRPLCIVNSDKDGIFPIDGVFKIYQSARRIYKLLGAEANIGLQVAEGPHADTQPLNTGEFHWMTRFLQGADRMSTLDAPAVHSIPMEKLKVFASSATGSGARPSEPAGLPKDEKNTTIDEILVPKAVEAKVPQNSQDWQMSKVTWNDALRQRCFSGWPDGEITPMIHDQEDTPSIEALRKTDWTCVLWNDGKLHWKLDTVKFAGESSDGVSIFRIVSVQNERSFPEPLLMEMPPQQIDEGTIFVMGRAGLETKDLELIVLNVLDEEGWQEFANTYAHKFPKLFPEGTKATPDDKAFEQEKKMFENFKWGMAYVCPRGIGPTKWDAEPRSPDTPVRTPASGNAAKPSGEEKSRIQRLRRFYLLGQTLEGQQVWDIRCAIRALRSIDGLKDTKLWLQASRTQAANVLIASLFEDNITRLDLHQLPHTLQSSNRLQSVTKTSAPAKADDYFQPPAYLNMLKYLDLPQAAAMAAERTRVVIYDDDKTAWNYPAQVSEKLGWGKEKKNGLQLRDVPKGN